MMKPIQLLFTAGLLAALAACAPESSLPTAPPTLTRAPLVITAVPTMAHTVTPPPTPMPTLSPVVRDALTGTGASLYVREAPASMAAIIRTINDLASRRFIGRSDDNEWIQAEFLDGASGWLMARAVALDLPITDLPVTGDGRTLSGVAIVQSETELRADPNNGADVVAALSALTPLRLIGRVEGGSWIQGETEDAESGWLQAERIAVNFDLSELPAVSVVLPTGRVSAAAGGLRLRQEPGADGRVLLNLPSLTLVTLEGRTADDNWLLIRTDSGFAGWVARAFIETDAPMSAVPSIADPEPVPFVAPTAPPNAPQVASAGGGARAIYLRGQGGGNQRGVFTTVGDSLTDSASFLRPLSNGYALGDYGYLLPVIQFYAGSFSQGSLAAVAGWGTVSALTPGLGGCGGGATPVTCEMQTRRPAAALILIGTNDAPAFDAGTYGERLRQIIDQTIAANVVPILSTLPPRADVNDNVIAYNATIRALANQYGIPLTDLYAALINLPNRGLSGDGIHLSEPPGGVAASVNFTADNLQYGATMRNLTALQILDTVWKQVLY
ncbi:MAG: SH3 domain-containing protein [Chloroflexota bacterium]|nr:SH3 domain-containing protein [Chloroflexota bacterium]